MSPRHVVIGLVGALSFALVAGGSACSAGRGGAAGGAADPARGAKYFKVKCNSCHPNGGQGAGPPLLGKLPPGPLKKNSSGGRHNVPDAEWDSLLAFVTPMMQPQAAAAAMAPALVPVAPVGVPAVLPAAAAPAVAPAPGMKTCNCTCQCPAGAPPGQLQNCTCACSCPPG